MKKQRHKNTFNLVIRFTVGVFAIMFLAGLISVGLIALLHVFGARLNELNPVVLLLLAIAPSCILGTVLAFVFGKNYLNNLNKVLTAVSEIGKGNFDVEITGIKGENMRDISENINIMANELKGLELLRKDFIQNFSHEFKTPIVSIQGFTDRLMTKKLTEEEKREYLEIIYEESSRLAALSTSTLFMSKLDSMTRLGEKKEFMLDEQIRRSVLLLDKQLKGKNLKVVINDLSPLRYLGDEEMLKQVWVNILSNAVKFSRENGSIHISAANSGEAVTVSVRDEGIGMSGEVLRRIFDKYYQGDSSHATAGNGLGLSIVKKIIELSGGSVSVKSKENEGSVFTVTLPA